MASLRVKVPVEPEDVHSCHLCVRAQNVKCHNTLIKHFKLKHSEVAICFECRYCRNPVASIKRYPSHRRNCQQAPSTGTRSPVPEASDTSDDSRSSLVTVPEAPVARECLRDVVVPVTDFDMITNRHLNQLISVTPDDLPELTTAAHGRSRHSDATNDDTSSSSTPIPARDTLTNLTDDDAFSTPAASPARTTGLIDNDLNPHRAAPPPIESLTAANNTEITEETERPVSAPISTLSARHGDSAATDEDPDHEPEAVRPITENEIAEFVAEARSRSENRRATCTVISASTAARLNQAASARRNAAPAPQESELTPLQAELLGKLRLDCCDLATLSGVATQLADAALRARQSERGEPTQRRPSRPDVGPTYVRRPPPRRRRYNATDASNIQKLYRRNRKKAMYHILNDMKPYCNAPKNDVHNHFTRLFSNNDYQVTAPPECIPNLPIAQDEDSSRLLTAPINRAEVVNRLARMTNTAPGPDGLRYFELSKIDPGCHVLSELYSKCLTLKQIPLSWKESKTALIFKAGDTNDLNNWRPLCLGNTIAKLYSAIIADRITRWANKNNLISNAQKGFLDFEGCLEHNFILQSAIEDSRRRGTQLCIAWLDLANAFGAIPHEHILNTLKALNMPEEAISIVTDMYHGAFTRAVTAEGMTDPVPILSGVKQGCPLSPILFNLALEPILRAVLNRLNATGYRMLEEADSGITVNLLAYADDLVLMAKDDDSLQSLLDICAEAADWCGLTFKPSKCATLHIDRKIRNSQQVLPTIFNIEESEIRALKAGEHYRHLGVPTGYKNRQTPEETVNEIVEKFKQIDTSLLAPWQKIDAAATFLMPKLDFIMRGAEVEIRPLTKADQVIKRLGKKWMFLPQRASPEIVHIAPSKGGAGLMPLRTGRYTLAIVQGFKMLTCNDEQVRRVALRSLRAVVQTKLRRPIENQDLVAYLNGQCNGTGGHKSFWARVRRSSFEVNKLFKIKWQWDPLLREIQLTVPKPSRDADSSETKLAQRPSVCYDLREATRAALLKRLLRKPDQGKVLEIATQATASNHMMRNGSFTRFADWRFVHRARLDCVPLNATKRFGDGPENCRKCPAVRETLPHVINCCHHHALARNLRHNAIASRIAKAIPSRLGTIRENQQVPGYTGERRLRPDIVITNEQEKRIIICDITVAFENRYDAFTRARQEKISKYEPIIEQYRDKGWTALQDAIVVGSLGSWDPANERTLRMLNISRRYAGLMRKLIVSDTIRWSRDMYVEHVTGQRQFPVNVPAPMPEDQA